MSRLMGDATHSNVAQLATVPGLQLAAGYDSGTPDIDWTPQDWARFPGLPHVHIDQAFNSTINTQAHVVVFDVEPGAYQPGQAGALIAQNVTARPTVYVNQANIVATVRSALTAPNWRGDTWAAIPGWQTGQPWPQPVADAIALGARIVAVQNQLEVASAYDLSVVLDPVWPLASQENNMMIIWAVSGNAYLLSGGRIHKILDTDFIQYYQAAGAQIAGTQNALVVNAAEEAALLADFPAGNPAVTVDARAMTISGTITPA